MIDNIGIGLPINRK